MVITIMDKYIILIVLLFSLCVSGNINSSELKSIRNNYVIIIMDNVILRREPTNKSKKITKLNIGYLVQFVKKQKNWIFVNTNIFKNSDVNDETIKGWVPNNCIADLKDFKKVKKFKKCKIEGDIGDYYINLEIKSNGSFIRKIRDYGTGNITSCKGTLYHFNKVFLARDEDKENVDLYLLNKNGDLCHADGPTICSKDTK